MENKPNHKLGIAVFGTALLIIFLMLRCTCSSDEDPVINREASAYRVARECVEKEVAPLSVRFNYMDLSHTKLNDSVYIVKGSFDYSNGNLNAKYKCLVLMKTDTTGTCNLTIY